MRSMLGLGVVVLVGSVGCGTTIYVGSDDDDGAGGSGTGGSTSTSIDGPGPTSVATTSTGVIENPPGCPDAAPTSYGECPSDQLTCSYAEEQGCTVTYTCFVVEECYEGTTGPGGGWGGDDDGGCYPYTYWQPVDASCPSAVECTVAQSGDPCALPGESCEEYGDDCSSIYKYCGEDHRWIVEEYWDECCYDDCCYEDCYCDPYWCPATPPATNDSCDPCWDSSYCGYAVETECGVLEVVASCNAETYTWDVSGEGCAGTGGAGGYDVTVGTSAQSGTGGGFGG